MVPIYRLLFAVSLSCYGVMAAAAEQRTPTTATTFGIYYQPGAPERTDLWQPGEPGRPLRLVGRVLTTGGAPIAGALIEIWHADAAGGVDETRHRASLRSGADGGFAIKTVLPGHIDPEWNNSSWGPRHIHVLVTPPDRPPLVTRIYFKGDDRLAGTPYPELAIPLEEARLDGQTVLFGRVELVLE